jgi:hypothetical protein
MITRAEAWENYVANLSWRHGHLDESTWCAFLRGASLGLVPEFARVVVCKRLRGAGAVMRPDKIVSQLERAYNYVEGKSKRPSGARARLRRAPSQIIDFEVVDYVVSNGPKLLELWKWPIEEPQTERVIDTLFPGNPLLCVGLSMSRFDTATRETWRGALAGAQFIVPSPMKARLGKTQGGRLSAHSLSNTGPRRFLVVEFDFHPSDPKWAFWIRKWEEGDRSVLDATAALLANLTAPGTARVHPLELVVYSGGKSLHGWFYCAGEHQGQLHAFMRRAIRLGADPKTWSRTQFVRMPDGRRADGRRQSVLYFNSSNR